MLGLQRCHINLYLKMCGKYVSLLRKIRKSLGKPKLQGALVPKLTLGPFLTLCLLQIVSMSIKFAKSNTLVHKIFHKKIS